MLPVLLVRLLQQVCYCQSLNNTYHSLRNASSLRKHNLENTLCFLTYALALKNEKSYEHSVEGIGMDSFKKTQRQHSQDVLSSFHILVNKNVQKRIQ